MVCFLLSSMNNGIYWPLFSIFQLSLLVSTLGVKMCSNNSHQCNGTLNRPKRTSSDDFAQTIGKGTSAMNLFLTSGQHLIVIYHLIKSQFFSDDDNTKTNLTEMIEQVKQLYLTPEDNTDIYPLDILPMILIIILINVAIIVWFQYKKYSDSNMRKYFFIIKKDKLKKKRFLLGKKSTEKSWIKYFRVGKNWIFEEEEEEENPNQDLVNYCLVE